MDDFVITMDLDWAPDFMIDAVAQQLLDANVKATIFVTHDSPAVRRLSEHPELFELGLHPNFLLNSSHGDTTESVLQYCVELVPDAISMRTHALVQSGHILTKVVECTSIEIDLSLLLPEMPNIQIVDLPLPKRHLLRLPYYWEDDLEAVRVNSTWNLSKHKQVQGLKVFDFHPVFIYLNSNTLESYAEMKRIGHLSDITPDQAQPFVNAGHGVESMFNDLIDFLAGRESYCVRDIVERYHTGER